MFLQRENGLSSHLTSPKFQPFVIKAAFGFLFVFVFTLMELPGPEINCRFVSIVMSGLVSYF